MRLEGQIAVVTGGGRGIGKAIALRLAGEGADLMLASPDEPELNETAADISALGRRAEVVVTDITKDDEVERLAARTREALGPVDVLVNNSGVAGPTAPLTELSRQDWDDVLAVNLTGAMLCCRALVPEMVRRRRGKIVNISSIAGRIGYALRGPYCVSKWGIIGLTLTLAKELGEHNIQANAVCPGPVDGPRIQQVFAARAAETGLSEDEVRREYLDQMALGRLVTADDVAAMVAFLASAEADNVTGQAVDVSAGWGS